MAKLPVPSFVFRMFYSAESKDGDNSTPRVEAPGEVVGHESPAGYATDGVGASSEWKQAPSGYVPR